MIFFFLILLKVQDLPRVPTNETPKLGVSDRYSAWP